ncbi:restriction endonuclease subunit S [Pseudomonas aeruginosa]|nr:restriction endonuclease subunit S [Pseudomonas aeruginosa]EIU7214501.1 restriction endonuclease subunit S [Pseudomonas aeruginosa]MBY5272179.1 restriction endonuclease subunit S [Pseudomonas aeruginosa]MCK1828170.1 restriction endonuclease subunit S [Pseudomonas aeruginosa]MCO2580997.1 restriction endonuclease subunit S [Pseudomonas aeruginosa]MCO2684225.1 restriction endonuclease subunit S [Pseudomonas aeruginosa]
MGVRNGIYKPAEFHGRGAKIVNMGELFAYPRLRAVPMRRIELNGNELERFGLQKHDLLFARRSLVAEGAGKCSIVMDVDGPTVFESSIIRARPDPSKANPIFLYYLWSSPLGAHLLGTIRRQVAVAGVTGKDLEQLEFPLPPISEQETIASVLGALDDKIEHNRKTAQELLHLAHAIFRAWFVDFEPVAAKAAGATSFPSMPHGVFDVLPTGFVDSDIGPVPEGWEVGRVGNLAELSKTQINPQNYPEEMFEHFSIPAFDAGMLPVAERGGAIKSSKFSVVPGCILLSKLNPRIPRVWLPSPVSSRRQIASTEFLVFVPRSPLDRHYLYCQFEQPSFREELAQDATGTSNSHQRVRPNDLLNKPVLVPPETIRSGFASIVDPLFALIAAHLSESTKMAEMRDYLLPKLLSGDVRVKVDTATPEVAP